MKKTAFFSGYSFFYTSYFSGIKILSAESLYCLRKHGFIFPGIRKKKAEICLKFFVSRTERKIFMNLFSKSGFLPDQVFLL